MVGVTRDWEHKEKALKAIYDVKSRQKLAEKVLLHAETIITFHDEDVVATSAAMAKWKSSQADLTKRGVFFDILASHKTKFRSSEVTGRMLRDLSYEEFVALYTDEYRGKATNDTIDGQRLKLADEHQFYRMHSRGPHEFLMLHLYDEHVEHFSEIETKRAFDSRRFYQHSESAERWKACVEEDSYPTYEYCRQALIELAKTKCVGSALRSADVQRAVMLGGGGAHSKDKVLIKALYEAGAYTATNPLEFVLLDISDAMLKRSAFELQRDRRNHPWNSILAPQFIVGDFLKMHRRRDAIRAGRDRILWNLAGGTLGNLIEDEFFASLNSVSNSGDLLILGVTLNEPIDTKEERLRAEAEYRNETLSKLFSQPVWEYVVSKKLSLDVNRIMQDVSVHFEDDVVAGVSDVPGSRSLVLKADIAGQGFRIVCHSKYEPKNLTKFVDDRGWEFVCMKASPLASHFSQFLFRKK